MTRRAGRARSDFEGPWAVVALLVGGILGPGGLAVPAPAAAQEAAPALAAFVEAVEVRREELIRIRRDIHRHPDPSGEEGRTAAIVADLLRDAGFDVTTGVGGHGVVGVLRGAATSPGDPVLSFRADMDAVRGAADDPMPFRSVVPGVHHVCGHDVHTTVGLALAVGFSGIRERLPGTVVLIFQPAEETATGAEAMLAEGVFDGAAAAVPPGPADAIFAYHTAPLPVGQIMTRPGTLLPGRDRVRITVRGEGDLAPVLRRASALVAAVATEGASAPSLPAGEPFVAVRGLRTVRAGSGAWQVVATLTTSDADASRIARTALEEGLAGLGSESAELDLAYEERFIAGTDNDPELVARSTAAARRVLGEAAVREPQTIPTVFSEDFGSFQRHVPGVMYYLGVSNAERGWVGMPHTPSYVADEEAIFVGAEAMGAIFLDLFGRG